MAKQRPEKKLVYPDGLPDNWIKLSELPGFDPTGLVVKVHAGEPQIMHSEGEPKRWSCDIWYDAMILPTGKAYAWSIGLPVEGIIYIDTWESRTYNAIKQWIVNFEYSILLWKLENAR